MTNIVLKIYMRLKNLLFLRMLLLCINDIWLIILKCVFFEMHCLVNLLVFPFV